MKILIIGQGGREHALAWKVAQSAKVSAVFVAPGNAGTDAEAKVSNVAIDSMDIKALVEFAKNAAIALTIVGPEAPLCAGIVDQFQAAGLPCFGPTQQAAQLEGSKIFCKEFLQKYHIPSARYAEFNDFAKAKAYLKNESYPLVIKADGLAAGKGVVIAQHEQEAIAALDNMLIQKQFGAAGSRIIIEEFLQGAEASFMVMCDGKTCLPLVTSQDHKTRDDHDLGPNTGGMGAYSPAPMMTPALQDKIMQRVIYPTLEGLAAEGINYVGFLYAGLMISDQDIKVLEYNCRLGDPETEVILMRMQSDLVTHCQHAMAGTLAQTDISWDPRPALDVVLAARGYPDSPEKGQEIIGLPVTTPPNVKIFHAGTQKQNNKIVSTGGRVLCITAIGDTLQQAQKQAYTTINLLNTESFHYRRDIGSRKLT